MDMDEKKISLNENNVHILRNNLEKRLDRSDMRKKLIGGISEEDVSLYVENIRHQFELIETELKKQIKELQISRDEIARDFESFRQTSADDKTRLQEALKSAVADSSHYIDECSAKDEIINKMNESFNSEINKLTSENLELERQLNESRKSTDRKAVGFKNEIDVIYNQLVNLKTQVEINDNLQQQLETERLRSEKAEKKISRLEEWISGLRANLKTFYMNTDTEIDNLYATIEKSKAD